LAPGLYPFSEHMSISRRTTRRHLRLRRRGESLRADSRSRIVNPVRRHRAARSPATGTATCPSFPRRNPVNRELVIGFVAARAG
jgi:hypothetical protein